jgi:hypothetical protein
MELECLYSKPVFIVTYYLPGRYTSLYKPRPRPFPAGESSSAGRAQRESQDDVHTSNLVCSQMHPNLSLVGFCARCCKDDYLHTCSMAYQASLHNHFCPDTTKVHVKISFQLNIANLNTSPLQMTMLPVQSHQGLIMVDTSPLLEGQTS